MAMKENSKKVLNYLKEINGDQVTAADVAETLGLEKRQVDGIFTSAIQRKGLGVAFGHPMYIKEIRADRNEIVLSGFEETYCKAIICRDLNFMGIPEPGEGETVRCQAKVRYHRSGQYASLENIGDSLFKVSFDQPVRFAAPGQSAVFYDNDDCILGGGFISEVIFV